MPTTTIGIEYEVYSSRDNPLRHRSRRPEGLAEGWLIKPDGSLDYTGYEMNSDGPQTVGLTDSKIARFAADRVAEIFDYSDRVGGVHDGSRAGMHIHIGRHRLNGHKLIEKWWGENLRAEWWADVVARCPERRRARHIDGPDEVTTPYRGHGSDMSWSFLPTVEFRLFPANGVPDDIIHWITQTLQLARELHTYQRGWADRVPRMVVDRNSPWDRTSPPHGKVHTVVDRFGGRQRFHLAPAPARL